MGFVFKGPHNLEFLNVLIIQFQDTKLIAESLSMERTLSAGQPLIPQWKSSKVPSSLLLGNQGFNPCHAKVQSIPFPFHQVAKGWQDCKGAGGRAGPAGQNGGWRSQHVSAPCRIIPLDFPQAKGDSNQSLSGSACRDLAGGSRLLGKTVRDWAFCEVVGLGMSSKPLSQRRPFPRPPV